LGYDANGNLSYKLTDGQADLFVFNHENRLAEIQRNGVTLESYLYDDAGQRVKKTSNGVETFYPFPHYEVEVNAGVTTETKYYFFGSQRMAMHKNGVLT
jgi:YD repeat-containing protein